MKVAVGLTVVGVVMACVMVFSFGLIVDVWVDLLVGLIVVFGMVVGFTVGLGLATVVGGGVDVAACVGAGAEFLLAEPHGMKRYLPTPEVETSGLGDLDESDIDMNPIFRNCLR